MKYALASDHAGYRLKEEMKEYLQSRGIEFEDLGPESDKKPVSYAEQGHKLAKYIKANDDVEGIGICGTGLGISYALNRHKGIRAARITSKEDATMAKQHSNANVLVFGGRQTTKTEAEAMFEAYETTEFEGGRHQERIDAIDK